MKAPAFRKEAQSSNSSGADVMLVFKVVGIFRPTSGKKNKHHYIHFDVAEDS